MGLGNVGAVFVFEWRRSWNSIGLAWWAILATFPVFIVVMIRLVADTSGITRPSQNEWSLFLFALVPLLVSMLGTLLWTAPAIWTELEHKSWIYLAMRPHGGTAVLLGKYLVAVTWVLPAALAGLTAAVIIAQSGASWQIWSTIARLACLSCPAYAALYLVLGTLFPKRSMVIAVAYTLVFELVTSFVPAVINKLTVQYRLRALFFEWADIQVSGQEVPNSTVLFGDAPPSHHVAFLVGYTLALLALAVFLIRTCEFSSADEGDV